jgi:hypothetical protein
MDLRTIPEDMADEVAFDTFMYGVNTASPGRIESFDGVTATVQMTVRLKILDNGVVRFLDPPLITNVPVVLPSSVGGGLFLTIPIKKGDPCLLVFGQRGIDNVVELGGMQNPVDGGIPETTRIRHHDMTDAICIPGLSLKPNAPASWAADAIEIRNAAKTVCFSVKADKIYVTGDISVTGNITTTGDVTAGTVSLKTHTHPQSGGGNTGVPNV